MRAIRERMKSALLLRGVRSKTAENYLSCARQLVLHYGRGAEELGRAELEEFFEHMPEELGRAAASTYNVYGAPLMVLYCDVLGRREEMSWFRRMKPLPNPAPTLTGSEVEALHARSRKRSTEQQCWWRTAAGCGSGRRAGCEWRTSTPRRW